MFVVSISWAFVCWVPAFAGTTLWRTSRRLAAGIEACGAEDALPLLAFTLERLYGVHGGDDRGQGHDRFTSASRRQTN